MRICAAQLQPDKGDVESNIEKHLTFLALANQNNIDVMFFPELSLTGYEPELASELVLAAEDSRLDVFQRVADDSSMTILVGAPTPAVEGVHISLIIFSPHQNRQVYAKRELHVDEYPYFVPGSLFHKFEVDGMALVPAICYESMLENNILEAKLAGADIYLASVAKHQNGVERGNIHYANMADKHAMTVLMANCIGSCDSFIAFGNSAVWERGKGRLTGLDHQQQGMVIYDTKYKQASIVTL